MQQKWTIWTIIKQGHIKIVPAKFDKVQQVV